MNSGSHPTLPRLHPAWKIWSNPLFLRFCRSRLRPQALGVSLLIVLMISGFIVAMAVPLATRSGMTPADAARTAIIPLLVLQGFILFILGTAQVSGGMTTEHDERVIDYQRLLPMTPMAKVLGYLFGLPVRETVMVLATMPFVVWAFWRGGVAVGTWLPLYAVMISSTVLYHFTGLLTGTVVRNRRWAFLISIGLVFSLYTVVPQLAKFGLVFFRYLTIRPVFDEVLPGLLPATARSVVKTLQGLDPTVKFFGLGFPESVFTAFSQIGLILVFAMMLHRKWRRADSHLLAKRPATVFYLWIQTLLLGNALPLIDSGDLFPSRGLRRYGIATPDWQPQAGEAVLMSGIYGLASLLLLFVLALIVTPTADRQVRGWRRAFKQGRERAGLSSEATTSFWCVMTMAVAGAVGWYLFTCGLVESRWFPGHVVHPGVLGVFTAVMLSSGVVFQSLLEIKGARVLGLAAMFVGAVPLMVGAVISAIDDRLQPVAAWLIGISPASLPFYAPASQLSLSELPAGLARAVPRAFHFWLAISLLTMIWLALELRKARKVRAKQARSASSGSVPAAPQPP
jgi:hypothetical protein